MKCKIHPERDATHTRLTVDRENSGIHTIAYTRIGMCDECTREAEMYIGNTAAIRPLETGQEAG